MDELISGGLGTNLRFLQVNVQYGSVRLTSNGNLVPGKREFCTAPNETIVGQVKK